MTPVADPADHSRLELKPEPVSTAPAFTVIVPTFRRVTSLRECLLGLSNQSLAPAQLIVVVRTEDDETAAALPQLSAEVGEFEIVRVERPGQTHALNTAIARAEHELVAFIDDDAVPKRDWLLRLAEQFEDPSVGAVGGKLIVPQVTASESSERLRVGGLTALGQPRGNHHAGDGEAREVQWLRGANMSYRRQLCRFDESLRGDGAQVANDSEASLRVHAAGWRVIYVPAAAVFHNAAPRTGADQRGRPSNRAMRDASFNEMITLLRWLPAGQGRRAAIYLLLAGTPRTPGPMSAVRSIVTGRQDISTAMTRCANATWGRVAAVRQWSRDRGQEDWAPRAAR
ncbi:MAG: glycosyltransferase family 2 protein [Thermoleophilaceae bacterium]|nr:glycosyltransferase family 2 protein [Thermoleophilaceae bacterium]